jgi:hypothetical protein
LAVGGFAGFFKVLFVCVGVRGRGAILHSVLMGQNIP